jgi:hypothetical protein
MKTPFGPRPRAARISARAALPVGLALLGGVFLAGVPAAAHGAVGASVRPSGAGSGAGAASGSASIGGSAGAAAGVSATGGSAETGSSLEAAASKAGSTGRKVAMSLIGLAFSIAGIVLAFRRDFKEAAGVFAVGIVAVLLATPAGVHLLQDTVNSLFGA